MSKELVASVHLIVEKIEYIEQVVVDAGNVTRALSDSVTTRPAILMHLTAIAEQFHRLKQANAQDILKNFDGEDLRGMYDTRTYIAHDYEGVNLAIIEWIVREGLPKLKSQCMEAIA